MMRLKVQINYVYARQCDKLPGIPVVCAGIVLKCRVECDATFSELTECSILRHLASQLYIATTSWLIDREVTVIESKLPVNHIIVNNLSAVKQVYDNATLKAQLHNFRHEYNYNNYNHFSALWILSETTQVSRYQKGKTRKVKPIWIYWSKRQWVAVASAEQ